MRDKGTCGPSWEGREANKQDGKVVGERKERRATAAQRQ